LHSIFLCAFYQNLWLYYDSNVSLKFNKQRENELQVLKSCLKSFWNCLAKITKEKQKRKEKGK
jgi:hypothetical protein